MDDSQIRLAFTEEAEKSLPAEFVGTYRHTSIQGTPMLHDIVAFVESGTEHRFKVVRRRWEHHADRTVLEILLALWSERYEQEVFDSTK